MFFDARRAAVPLLAALAAWVLSACGAVQTQDAGQAAREPLYAQRLARLGPLDTWALEGRLAVTDDQDGGSGFLNWRQSPGESQLNFHGALGRGAWRLQADAAGAQLEFADGRIFSADSIDDLVTGQIGWNVPVDKLSWWIRGLAAPGQPGQRVLDEEGRLSLLNQHGWTIEYGRYATVDGEAMPSKMTARQADRTVKLAVRKWDLQPDHD